MRGKLKAARLQSVLDYLRLCFWGGLGVFSVVMLGASIHWLAVGKVQIAFPGIIWAFLISFLLLPAGSLLMWFVVNSILAFTRRKSQNHTSAKRPREY